MTSPDQRAILTMIAVLIVLAIIAVTSIAEPTRPLVRPTPVGVVRKLSIGNRPGL